ncbi:MAG: hypothetical protein ACLFSY_09305 [Desulfonatronovibrionaceae bacterium]
MQKLKSLIKTKAGGVKAFAILCALCLALVGGQAFATDDGYEQSGEQSEYSETQENTEGYNTGSEEESGGEEETYGEESSEDQSNEYEEPEDEGGDEEQGW